ncbi:hypothetical protein [Chitinophaga sp. OAE865]|uniref:hypothetical protein n=1 Tax=Chitinophaga sp. OAE865 TaxID=2817898 RepID=UPI001AE65056
MKVFFAIPLTILLFVSCKRDFKEENVLQADNLKGLAATEMSHGQILKPDNPRNKCDSIGIIHNQTLKYVYTAMLANNDSSLAFMRKSVIRFFIQKYGSNIGAHLAEKDIAYQPFKNMDIKKLLSLHIVPQQMSGFLLEMVQAAYLLKSPQDFNKFYKIMVNLEERINGSNKVLTPIQRDRLLHVASVTRHSAWFWLSFMPNQGQTTDGFLRSLLGLWADQHNAIWALLTFQEFTHLAEYAADESAMALWYYDAWM